MSLNLEQLGGRGRNAIQIALAQELFGNTGVSNDEILHNWVNQGYAKKFDEYLKEHPEMEDKLFIDQSNDAYKELREKIIYH